MVEFECASTPEGLEKVVEVLCQRIDALRASSQSSDRKRILVALAGCPGSGKSSVSSALHKTLRARGETSIAILPMDGFHYPKAHLRAMPEPNEAFRRRGAPFTFSVDAFLSLVKNLRDLSVSLPGEPETITYAPGFDHAVQDPTSDAISISSQVNLVVIEGNYTLLNIAPWAEMQELVDDKWFVDAPVDTLIQRLVDRHLQAGLDVSREAALARVMENDVPNGQLIMKNLIQPDIWIRN